MEAIIAKIATIGIAGIGAQWVAWRYKIPAIVLLAVAGLLLGPATGLIVPERDFGRLFQPLVAVAVAIILFEGGLTLNFAEIRHTSTAVRRLVIIGAPLAWVLGTAAAHYVAGLPLPSAIVLGGVLVVTGPTVIMPLLRQAKLTQRPASLLRWEAIVNDPVGALFAVLAFETMLVLRAGGSPEELAIRAGIALSMALVGGFLIGRIIAVLFNRGLVPEYLKAPLLLVAVLGAYTLSQLALDESGLLTVTVLGITLANARIESLDEIRRFKETITVLLVSGVFVMLSANVDSSIFAALDWRAAAFVAVMLLVVRPVTTWIATIGSGLTWQERALIGWIAPRGVVAIAVASFFAGKMTDLYFDGGRGMIALSFAIVMTTVVLHGFSLGPLARALGLSAPEQSGVLFVGANPFSVGLAAKLHEQKVPVLIADANWNHLREARNAGLSTFHGEVLSEAAEHAVDLNPYGQLVAATDNDAYNTLVCADFAFEFSRHNIFQLALADRKPGAAREDAPLTGGRRLLVGQALVRDLEWFGARDNAFSSTRITGKFDLDQLRASKSANWQPVLAIKPDKKIVFASVGETFKAAENDVVIGVG